nr:MAG TPA: hypothetical protein [Crassvirales sp.]
MLFFNKNPCKYGNFFVYLLIGFKFNQMVRLTSG